MMRFSSSGARRAVVRELERVSGQMVLPGASTPQLEQWGIGVVQASPARPRAGESGRADQLLDGVVVVSGSAIGICEGVDGLSESFLDGGFRSLDLLPCAGRSQTGEDGM